MKTSKFALTVTALLLIASIFSTGCKKDSESGNVDCAGLSTKINQDKAAFNTSPTTANCHQVVVDYNNYINDNCTDAASYQNELDAFEMANHCQ